MDDLDKELKALKQTVREQADDLYHSRGRAVELELQACAYRRRITALEMEVKRLQGLATEHQRSSLRARVGVLSLRDNEPTGITQWPGYSRRRSG